MGEEWDGELVITARNLRKMYGPHLALDDIDLEIPSGAVGILGPNGAGKSTLFKCLLGLITTTSGEGTVLGYDIKTEGDKIRSRIGYMPEYDALDPGLSAIDQVRYAGELLGMNPAPSNYPCMCSQLPNINALNTRPHPGMPTLSCNYCNYQTPHGDSLCKC